MADGGDGITQTRNKFCHGNRYRRARFGATKTGARLLITADEIIGTIGGGHLENEALKQGRKILDNGHRAPVLETKTFPLGASLGQCCGGKVALSFESVLSEKPCLAVFGAGHIGQALAPVLAALPYQTVFYDSRSAWLQKIVCNGNIKTSPCDNEAHDAARIPADSGVLVMTHSHALDMDICAAALARKDIPFVALIGSESKARRFREQLKQRSIDVSRLICPIGKNTANARQPEKIAVQIAAALIEHLPQSALPTAREEAITMRTLEE